MRKVTKAAKQLTGAILALALLSSAPAAIAWAEESTAEEGTAEEGTAEDSTVEESTAGNNTAEDIAAGEGAAGESTAEEGTAGESTAEESSPEQTQEDSGEENAETPVSDLTWEAYLADLDEDGKALFEEGRILILEEAGLQIWVPDSFNLVDLSEEDREIGYLAYMEAPDLSAAAGLMYVDINEMSMKDYETFLEEALGDTVEDELVINGFPAFIYLSEETDTRTVFFENGDGTPLEFSFAPASDSSCEALRSMMTATLGPIAEQTPAASDSSAEAE